MSDETPRCKTCGVPLLYTGGRPRKYCPEHSPNKKRDQAAAAARADRQAAAAEVIPGGSPTASDEKARREAAKLAAAIAAGAAARAWRPYRLAVALGWDEDPRRAAELVGIVVDDAELAELTAQARELTGLIERDPTAIGDLVNGALALRAIELSAGRSDDAAALRRLAETLVLVLGKSSKVYTAFKDVLELPGGKEWTPDELLPPELRVVPGGKS
jgi:uncharacterized Zn finger protein (UPF0148 family)